MKGEEGNKIATAINQKKKIKRANTGQDIDSDDLECSMINNLNMDINSIDENNMSDYIKVPVGAQLHQSWAKGAELEKSFSKHSVPLSAEIEKVPTEAKEGTQKALTTPLQKYITSVFSETYQNLPEEAVP